MSIAKSLREYAQGQTPKRFVATVRKSGDFNRHEPDLQAGNTLADVPLATLSEGLALAKGRGSLAQSIFRGENMSELETFRAKTAPGLKKTARLPCGP